MNGGRGPNIKLVWNLALSLWFLRRWLRKSAGRHSRLNFGASWLDARWFLRKRATPMTRDGCWARRAGTADVVDAVVVTVAVRRQAVILTGNAGDAVLRAQASGERYLCGLRAIEAE